MLQGLAIYTVRLLQFGSEIAISMSKYSVFLAACLLCVFATCAGQDPVVEDVCEQEGFPGVNLSCEREGGLRECFSRDKLCDGTLFCADGSDEGQTTGTGLDCEIKYVKITIFSFQI